MEADVKQKLSLCSHETYTGREATDPHILNLACIPDGGEGSDSRPDRLTPATR